MELWNQLQPYVIEILIGIATIGAIIMKAPKTSLLEKLERKQAKAHNNTRKEEKKYVKCLEKEKTLDKKVEETKKELNK